MADQSRVILVPVHASASSRAALSRARDLATSTGNRLRLVVVQPVSAFGAEEIGSGESPLSTLAEGELRMDDHVLVISGDPFSVILKESFRDDVDLVVMGRGRRSWMGRRFQPPLHERISRRAEVPVMAVPAGAGRRTRSVGLFAMDGAAEGSSSTPSRGHLRLVEPAPAQPTNRRPA